MFCHVSLFDILSRILEMASFAVPKKKERVDSRGSIVLGGEELKEINGSSPYLRLRFAYHVVWGRFSR